MLDLAKLIELKAGGKLPSPPASALRALELCQRESSTIPEIIRALQTDPAMVGRILKLANSAVYGRPRPAVELSPGILMSIGIKAVRQVVLAFSLVANNRSGGCKQFDYDHFWSRSIATAVAARIVGSTVRVAPASELFTVGLLAHIGLLALASVYPERLGPLLQESGDPFAPRLLELEQASFGFTHFELGAAMMHDWGLPQLFVEAAQFQGALDQAPFPSGSRAAAIAHCLALAVRMAAACFMPKGARRKEFVELRKLAGAQDISEGDFDACWDQMLDEWKDWSKELSTPYPEVLPSASLLESTGDAEATPPATTEEAVTILVVDDDPSMRLILQRQLSAMGHQVHLARDGAEGLALAVKCQPHIVITDLLMPNVDGFALIRGLRSSQQGQQMYLIVLTVHGEQENLVKAFELGVDDFMMKPVEIKVIEARLKAAIRVVRKQEVHQHERSDLEQRLFEMAIVNHRSQLAARVDTLTGLYNRRYAMERLTQAWSESERNGNPVSVLMLDIDHFKQINDRHGHDAGDAVLQQFASVLRSFSRVEDISCRFGGEEFLMITPGTRLAGARHLAERIRDAVDKRSFDTGGAALHITVSIGVAQKEPDQRTLEALVKAADNAMYQAKHSGRNTVC